MRKGGQISVDKKLARLSVEMKCGGWLCFQWPCPTVYKCGASDFSLDFVASVAHASRGILTKLVATTIFAREHSSTITSELTEGKRLMTT